jgi:hypothetical protein
VRDDKRQIHGGWRCLLAAQKKQDKTERLKHSGGGGAWGNGMMNRIWTIIARGTAGLLGVLLVLGTSGFACRMYRLHQLAEVVRTPHGIDEASFVKVGGIDQWVTIRGQNRDNPVLLFLHGGPGFAFLSLNPRALVKWEKDFILVQWDQRGEGGT